MRLAGGVAAAAIAAGPALAAGVERSAQSADILFEAGDRVKLTFAGVQPTVAGRTELQAPVAPGGAPVDLGGALGNIATDFSAASAALKVELSERLDVALIGREVFGADVVYPASDPVLGGTAARADTHVLKALVKYRLTDRISAFGGIRRDSAEGAIALGGAAYGELDGAHADLETDTALGYTLGAAYEIPEIALRTTLTYNSEIEHELIVTESDPPIEELGVLPVLDGDSALDFALPQSLDLSVQTGVAAGTLLFGSVHSQIGGETPIAYRLGVGRKLGDRLSGTIGIAHRAGGDRGVSTLTPLRGFTELSVGAAYDVTDSVALSGGLSYRRLDDATPEALGVPRGELTDNKAVSLLLSLAYTF